MAWYADNTERHRYGKSAEASIAVRAPAASSYHAPGCPSGFVGLLIDMPVAFDAQDER